VFTSTPGHLVYGSHWSIYIINLEKPYHIFSDLFCLTVSIVLWYISVNKLFIQCVHILFIS
jgi:hypothetical protein